MKDRFMMAGPKCGSRSVGHMFGIITAIAIAAIVSVPGVITPQSAVAQLVPNDGFAELVDRVGPAVVNISTRKETGEAEEVPVPEFPPGSPFEEFFKEFFDRDREREQPQRRGLSLGSGFVIDPAGFVVTNNHVIAEADEIKVTFSDNSEYIAELVGRDPKTDLALLKIDGDEPFPSVEWADSDDVRVGDWMLAIGNPFGLGFSVTAGIVSARGRDIQTGPYDDFFQVDAAINRGNSGGPSFTLDGRVFGVNTAIFSPTGNNVGIGFAIPAKLAQRVINSLQDTGRVARGWLGVRIQSVTDEIAESLGLDGPQGALVASVTEGGPAESAGIVMGDVIIRFDDQPIDSMRELPRIVAETPIGEDVDVVIWRRGEESTIQVELGELPDDEELAALTNPAEEDQPRITSTIDELGVTVAILDDALRTEYELSDEAKGVVIIEVDPNSAAAEQSLRPGDVIVEIGQEEVNSPPEVMARVGQVSDEGKNSVLMLIDRQGDLRFVALPLSS